MEYRWISILSPPLLLIVKPNFYIMLNKDKLPLQENHPAFVCLNGRAYECTVLKIHRHTVEVFRKGSQPETFQRGIVKADAQDADDLCVKQMK